MKYAVEMIYIPSFIKIESGIQKLIEGKGGGANSQARRQHGDRISLL
jgi:hypothetical protein